MSKAASNGPDYNVDIDADELIADLVAKTQDVAQRRDEYRADWRDELANAVEPHPQYRFWVREQTGLLTALSRAIAALQPEAHNPMVRTFREDNGAVDVRGYMRWLSDEADAHHEIVNERRNAPRSRKMETGYCRVLSLLRDDYGVGWPRLDELGGNPLECDLP